MQLTVNTDRKTRKEEDEEEEDEIEKNFSVT